MSETVRTMRDVWRWFPRTGCIGSDNGTACPLRQGLAEAGLIPKQTNGDVVPDGPSASILTIDSGEVLVIEDATLDALAKANYEAPQPQPNFIPWEWARDFTKEVWRARTLAVLSLLGTVERAEWVASGKLSIATSGNPDQDAIAPDGGGNCIFLGDFGDDGEHVRIAKLKGAP